MTASTQRIRTQRDVEAMVALDTIEPLADRVRNLLAHGRRITTTQRYTYTQQPPEVVAGQTLDPDRPFEQWSRAGSAGFSVRLAPGLLAGFGFSAYDHDGNATEAEARRRYHASGTDERHGPRSLRDATLVTINGGLDGDGPARDDLIVVKHWNRDGVCDERVIVFDYESHRAHVELAEAHAALRDHMEHLRDKQPWDNKAMFQLVLAALDRHAGGAR